MRLMGKRQIGEMQPYEFIITLLIAEVACAPMSDISIPLTYGVAAIFSIFILHQLLSFIEQRGQHWKALLSGKPSMIITPDGINISELKKNNLDIEDLMQALRCFGVFSLDEVRFGLLESNGKISIIKNKSQSKTSTPPLLLISNGKILHKNFNKMADDFKDLKECLSKLFTKFPKNVEVLTMEASGKIYYKETSKKYNTIYLEKQL